MCNEGWCVGTVCVCGGGGGDGGTILNTLKGGGIKKIVGA